MAAKAGGAEIVVKFKRVGDDVVRKAIESVSKASQKAARDARTTQRQAERDAVTSAKREAQARTREAEKSAKAIERRNQMMRRSMVRETQRAHREEVQSAKNAARLEEKAAQDLAKRQTALRRSFVRETQRAYKDAERAARAAEMAQRRTTQQFRRGLATGAVGISTVAASALGASQRAQGVLGIRSQDDVLTSAINSRGNFIRTAMGAGLSTEQRGRLSTEAIAIGSRTGLGPEAVMNMIGTSQELFSGLAAARESGTLPEFMASMENMAKFSVATGANATDVVTLRGEAMRQLSLSAEEADQALALFAQGAQDGSLNVADFASSFSEIMSPFALLRGNQGTGLGAVREFQALGQALKAGGQSAEGARTLQSNMFAAFQNDETRARMARAGVDIMESDGQGGQRLRNTASIIAQMAQDSDFQGINLGSIVHDRQARDALQILMAQEQAAMRGQAGSMTLGARQEVSTVAAGTDLIDRTFAEIQNDPSGRAARMRAERESSIFSQQDRLTEAMLDVAGPLTGLQNEFPLLTAALEELTPVIQGLVAFAFARAVLPGSFMSTAAPVTGASAMANIAAGAGTGTAAATGGSLAAANAALSGFLIGAGQLLVAGIAGAVAGLHISDMISDAITGQNAAQERENMSQADKGYWGMATEAWSQRWGSAAESRDAQNSPENVAMRVQEAAARREKAARDQQNTAAIVQALARVEGAVKANKPGFPSGGSPGDTRANGQRQ